MNGIDTPTIVNLVIVGVNVLLTIIILVILFSLGDLIKNLCGMISSDISDKVDNIVDGSKRIERICDAINQRTKAQTSNRKTAAKSENKKQTRNNGGRKYVKKGSNTSSSSRN